MSSGSWCYLYSKEVDDLMKCSSIGLLEDMVDRLIESGYEDVAKDTRQLVEHIKSAKAKIETLFEQLRPIFKAVEWYDSADWSKDNLDKAVEDYRHRHIKEECCEWETILTPQYGIPFYYTSCGKIRLSHQTGYDIYCGFCGRKIKIVDDMKGGVSE